MKLLSILPLTSKESSLTSRWQNVQSILLQISGLRITLALLITVSLLLLFFSSFESNLNFISSIQPLADNSTVSTNTPTITSTNTTVATSLKQHPQIFDVILFNNELDWLEIRLHELGEYVDYFVIIESEITFTGNQRSLSYQENQERFKAFERQIIHIVVPVELLINKGNAWNVELWTRNYGFLGVIETQKPKEGDWLILSDIDEIPRKSTVASMKDPSLSFYPGRLFGDVGTVGSGGDLFRLGCQFYYYSFEYRHVGTLWIGPVVVRFRELDSPKLLKQRGEAQRIAMSNMVKGGWKEAGGSLRDYRNRAEATYVDDACIHCTWCFSNITQVINKMESYSHGEHNQDKYKDQSWIVEKYRNGQDLFERAGDKFDYIEDNLDIPYYVLEHQDQYQYLLSRRGANGGFVDVVINPE